MRRRLSGLSTYALNGQCLGDEHLAYAPLGYGHLCLFLASSVPESHGDKLVLVSSSYTVRNCYYV